MTFEMIQTAQEYLTVSNGNGEMKKIVNVEPLLKRHPPHSVIKVLKELLRKKEKTLICLVGINKTRIEVDETIAEMFRLHMAIKILERGIEEVRIPCQN